MVYELTYTTLSLVLESWENVRRIKDYEQKAGRMLFQKLFKECPEAKTLFGFPIDIDTDSAELLESKRFIMHSSYLIQMLDSALNMLGPDIEMLTEIMTDLGKKHVAYMVTPEMYPIFGESLLHAIATLLGDQFTDVTQQAWQEVYNDLTADMIRSYQDK